MLTDELDLKEAGRWVTEDRQRVLITHHTFSTARPLQLN